jgi:uncharacterized membrane protein
MTETQSNLDASPNGEAIEPPAAEAAPDHRHGGARTSRTVQRALSALSGLGLLLGALFFAASLTPSLIPRVYVFQGVVGGTAFAAGYGLGCAIRWLWRLLELPEPRGGLRRASLYGASAAACIVVLFSLSQAAGWQNSIRERMGMTLVDSAHPMRILLIAGAVAGALILLGLSFSVTRRLLERRFNRIAPSRAARVLGVIAAAGLFWFVIDGVVFRMLLRAYDASSAALDALVEPDIPMPAEPWRTGSADSLVAWQELGRTGRAFVTTGASAAEIEAFAGRGAQQPLRVYVGLNAARSADERAALALREMIRVGAFERSVLVVAVPTGTGWMDPAAVDPLEYLHLGDVAVVAVQYSYLQSWVSLIVEPDYGSEAGRALFRAVYGHWTNLPPDERPRLYLHGLSLGSLSSERSLRLHEVLADPIEGALWVGPPFPSQTWRSATLERQPDTPAWLPTFGDGSIVRFANQWTDADRPGAAWGPMRIVYLQYASDPIVFFEASSFYSRPDWMTGPRAPDVSPDLRWYPVVTFLQLLLDMAVSMAVPQGFGHSYAPEHYIDGWLSVTEPDAWDDRDTDRLKALFATEREAR